MKRILSILGLCLLAPAVFAAPSFFTPAANDQSMYFLAAIFGKVGDVLPIQGSTLLLYTFYYFNQAVLVLGCIVILYTLVVSTINTSHSGEMMGAKWNSVWIPLRTAMGFALLLPIGPAPSYAVVQALIMWVIVQGVGAADYLWSNVVEKIMEGEATIQVDTASSTSAADTVMSAFQYFVCAIEFAQVQGLEDYQTQDNGNNPHGNYKSGKNKNNYLKTAPRVTFSVSNATAAQPNTSFWTFGIGNPTSWSVQSICGTISTPAAGEQQNGQWTLQQQYYNNQRNILATTLGLSNSNSGGSSNFLTPLWVGKTPVSLLHPSAAGTSVQLYGLAPSYSGNPPVYDNADSWGRYGGNWLGDYGKGSTPDDRAPPQNPLPTVPTGGLNGRYNGLQYMQPQADGTYQLVILPTVAYLAELLAQNIDAGSPTANPTSTVSTSTSSKTENDSGDETTLSTSQVTEYVQQQLAWVAQAYTDAIAANYAAYQAELTGQTYDPTSTSAVAQTKQNLANAAKFNGWASAGALYLNIAKILQATTSSIAATTDFSYGALACAKGVGPSTEAQSNNMLCKDARAPTDVGGIAGKHGGSTKLKNSGTALGDAIVQAQDATNQALGLLVSSDTGEGTGGGKEGPNGEVCTPQTYITPSGGKYTQDCGIYNSTNSSAFDPTAIRKPAFPKMIINPLAWYNYVNDMMIYNFAQTLVPLVEMGQSAVMANPILTLRQSGIRLLNTSAKLYHVGQRYMWFSGLVSYVASNWSPIAGAAFSTFNWAASMATAMVAAMMAMGAIMAYYFPMIPYLVFTFATIQWLILTIEAMTAAPLMALGILHPEGNHEVFGHSSMGIAMLSSVFLRPSLMIVGYFAATLMCYVVVLLLNAGFFFAANSMLSGDSSSGSVFACIVIWMMYLNAVMICINKAFSLIYHIPDHVTRWIGIQEPGASDVEQMLGKVQEGVKQGGELGKAAKDSALSSRMSTADTAGQQRAPQKKKEKKE